MRGVGDDHIYALWLHQNGKELRKGQEGFAKNGILALQVYVSTSSLGR